MRKKAIKYKILLFLSVGMVLFDVLQNLMLDKSSYGKWRNYNTQENIDILILGNSHADCGIGAYHISESFRKICNEDVSVFNCAIYGMRIEQMYFFAVEALKIHTPKLIILETFSFCPLKDEHRGILAHRAFDVLPLNRNKINGINYCVNGEHWSYYIPLIKYHTRWKELTGVDVTMLYDEAKWNSKGLGTEDEFTHNVEVCQDQGDGWFLQDTSQVDEQRALTRSEKECLEKLLVLLEEKNIKLMFVSVPYKEQMGLDSMEQIKINNYLQEHYVNEDSICMLDMNRMWRKLDIGYDDLFNEGHLNGKGAEKVTGCLFQYLKENYKIDSITR